jgi:hypothetical protein
VAFIQSVLLDSETWVSCHTELVGSVRGSCVCVYVTLAVVCYDKAHNIRVFRCDPHPVSRASWTTEKYTGQHQGYLTSGYILSSQQSTVRISKDFHCQYNHIFTATFHSNPRFSPHRTKMRPCGVGSPGNSVVFSLSAKSSGSYIYYTFTFSFYLCHVLCCSFSHRLVFLLNPLVT